MQNREAMFLPEIEDLFKRALEKHPDKDYSDVWSWVGAFLPDPELGVFIARIEGDWKGLAVVSVKKSVWEPDPIVLFLYSGSRGVFNALMAEIRQFCSPRSSRFRFVNGTEHGTKSYLRLLRPWVTGAQSHDLVECVWQEGPT